MVDDAIEIIRMRNNFYRDNYRRLVIALMVMLLVAVCLIGTVFYQATHRAEPKYFATTTDGRVMPLYPLDEPMLTPTELLQWAHEAAVLAYSYNFVDYREAFQGLQNEFTPDGWQHYLSALKTSRMLDMVVAKKLVVSAVATGDPVIVGQKIDNGKYAWEVKMPLLVTYQSPNEQTQQPVTIDMIISRVPTVDMPKGIAIVSFISSTGSVSQ